MSLKPTFQINPKKIFNIELCMFCQTDCGNSIAAKSELFLKIQQNITRLLAIDNYKLLYEFVKDKSEEELSSGLGLSYSYQCRRDYNRQQSNLKRSLQCLHSRKETTLKGTRLNRSVVLLFNYEKCLFCQGGNESGVLHDIQADTKDIQLKTAFYECPVALQVYKIRSLGALDAMAGELKYHQSCWNKIIVNRQVEVCFSSPRPTSTMYTSPTTTRTKFD